MLINDNDDTVSPEAAELAKSITALISTLMRYILIANTGERVFDYSKPEHAVAVCIDRLAWHPKEAKPKTDCTPTCPACGHRQSDHVPEGCDIDGCPCLIGMAAFETTPREYAPAGTLARAKEVEDALVKYGGHFRGCGEEPACGCGWNETRDRLFPKGGGSR